MSIQDTYTEGMKAPPPGTLTGSGETIDSFTGNAETDGIPFGRAVSRGTVATHGDNAVILGGTTALFRGVSIRDVTVKAGNDDEYKEYDNVGVLRKGEIWLEPSVAITAGDPVHFNGTTGVFTNTGGIGPIKGARWQTSCPLNGRAIAYFAGLEKLDGV